MESIWTREYQSKLTSAQNAVKVVNDGDWVAYPAFAMQAPLLDQALADRKDELQDVTCLFATLTYIPAVVKADPEAKSFNFIDGSFSAATRKIRASGTPIYCAPGLLHENPRAYEVGLKNIDVIFLSVTPMDKNGYFRFSLAAAGQIAMLRSKGGFKKNMKIIVEVNPKMPYVQGDNFVHISDVSYVIEETESRPPQAIPSVTGTEMDEKIAKLVVSQIPDGACLQLGIGGLPNTIGKLIAQSDLHDLGCHTEMFVNAYMDLFNAGKLTNKRKNIHYGKSVFTFAMGSAELYDFLDGNPAVECLDVTYVNDPHVIAQNDRMISICSCLSVDIFGNVSSESDGYRQISGTGGALDYHFGAYHSRGGRAFMCMPSTSTDRKTGAITSNVVMNFRTGTQITVPGNMTNTVVTEYGIAELKSKSTWAKVDALVSVAHPDFREGLIKGAEEAGIWRRSNKR